MTLISGRNFFFPGSDCAAQQPIVFATYPLLAHIHYADTIFNLVFFISLSSVLLQGTTPSIDGKMASRKCTTQIKKENFLSTLSLRMTQSRSLSSWIFPKTLPLLGKPVVQLKLPKTALIVLIHRDDRYLTADGDTIIQGKDHLLIMADSEQTVMRVHECFETLK
ncbi:MAG: TrkA C-terminal domain-containing protein [Bacteroidota bacterium]